MTTANYTVITISLDHVWAGSGKLIDGMISDCGAQFGSDQEESEVVYEMIEEAIEDGKDSMTIEIEGKDTLVTWHIIEPTLVATGETAQEDEILEAREAGTISDDEIRAAGFSHLID